MCASNWSLGEKPDDGPGNEWTVSTDLSVEPTAGPLSLTRPSPAPES